ncbi:nucleotidyltransferase domain-containing protein [Glycomyces sp. NPDC049804]|uniref:nucleotidyltransferase family protein n=1 Tax=Glycomyces sp. NPDC049804 TaxID=3154363 RepID=UPI0034402121
MHHHTQALAIAERVAAELAPGTLGIGLFGSVAAGTDHPQSDIDLFLVVDTGAGTEVRQVEGRMVTLSRKTRDDLEGGLAHPWEAVTAVGAWRRARILHDPDGRMAALQARARAWTWEAIGPEADRWAARELVGLAEEVHKIHGMLVLDRPRAAAANRAVLVLQLGYALAVSGRLTCESENDLWDAVADAEGPDWAAAWDAAAGILPADHETGCRAALALYRHAAGRLTPHLDAGERAVVDTAGALAA